MERKNENCRILIVDDDGDLCQILNMILRDICRIQIEHTLKAASDYLAGADLNLSQLILLLDNNLPDGDGVDYIPAIRSLSPAIKVVLMTADQTPGIADHAISMGADLFLPKPLAVAAIRKHILTICPELSA